MTFKHLVLSDRPKEETALAQINQAKALLDKAESLEQVLDIRAVADSVATLARAKGADEAHLKALDIKIRAERKAGQFVDNIPKEQGKRVDTSDQVGTKLEQIKKEYGKGNVQRWTELGRIPEPQFEKLISDSPKVAQSAILGQAKVIQNEKALKEKKAAYIEKAKSIELSKDLADFRVGDFRTQLTELRNVDLILADPPYPEEFISLYGDLARFASVALREGGSLITMLGHDHLPEVLDELRTGSSNDLHYHSVLAQLHRLDRTASDFPARTLHAWKPLFWFVKGKFEGDWHFDLIPQSTPQKELHPWQQNAKDAEPLIEYYSKPGDLICDPMMGHGSFALAAVKLKRKFVGCELLSEKVEIAKGRLAEMIQA